MIQINTNATQLPVAIMTELPELQTIDYLIATLEQFADQADLNNYYGLQYACLLIAEALRELSAYQLEPSADLVATLDNLPALFEAYRDNSQDMLGRIIEIVCHPELNIILADDELAMLERLLILDDLTESVELPEKAVLFEAENLPGFPGSPLADNLDLQDQPDPIAAIEQLADQAAFDGYYGLQDACLLIVEALQELTVPTLDIVNILDRLPLLIAKYRQQPQAASDEILAILRHADLNIPLAEDELAMLEAQLRAAAHQETDTGNENTDCPRPVSKAMREVIDLLQAEAALISHYLLSMPIDDLESVDPCLQQIEDELARYAKASHIAGFEGLALICEQVTVNIELFRQDVAAFTADHITLLREWTDQVKDYLANFNEEDAGLPLLVQLSNTDWAAPLSPEAGMTILAKLRAADSDDYAFLEESQPRQQIATEEDVSLTLPDDVNQELLEVLLQELPAQIQQFSEAIQRLQSDGNAKYLETAQRVAHTIKGSANTVGIKGIAVLTHHLEDILVACAREDRSPGVTLLNVLIDAADCLEEMSEFLIGLTEAPQDARIVLQEILDWANRIDQVGIEGLDDIVPIRPGNTATYADTPETLAGMGHDDADRGNMQSAMVRVPSEQIEHLFRISGESLILNSQAGERLRRLKNQLQAMELQFNLLRQLGDELEQLIDLKDLSGRLQGNLESDFDALEMDQYNELHTASRRMVEAAVDAREMSLDAKKELEQMNELLEYQKRLVIDTQEAVMQTRLVPIASIIPRLQRGLRQTCRLTGKLSELTLSGEQLLIDGDTLNAMVDPLMHLLRNAIDHGIESEAERLAMAKPKTGQIAIKFDREGNTLLVRCRR